MHPCVDRCSAIAVARDEVDDRWDRLHAADGTDRARRAHRGGDDPGEVPGLLLREHEALVVRRRARCVYRLVDADELDVRVGTSLSERRLHHEGLESDRHHDVVALVHEPLDGPCVGLGRRRGDDGLGRAVDRLRAGAHPCPRVLDEAAVRERRPVGDQAHARARSCRARGGGSRRRRDRWARDGEHERGRGEDGEHAAHRTAPRDASRGSVPPPARRGPGGTVADRASQPPAPLDRGAGVIRALGPDGAFVLARSLACVG